MKEDDLLIAEFVGLVMNKDKSRYKNSGSPFDIGYSRSFDDLEFNQSWDWLMPVIDKIETIERRDLRGLNGTFFRLEMHGNYANWNGHPPSTIGESRIDAVYQLVVQFIKWYNPH
tara:strand:- start:3803 stop:4147 length:345 start_codon:yes stop_codon:yes gene_type:complete